MRRKTHIVVVLLAGALVLGAQAVMGADGASKEGAGDSPSQSSDAAARPHQKSEVHGGQVFVAKAHVFETVYAPDRVYIYMYTAKDEPAAFEGTRGLATVRFQDGKVHVLPLEIDFPQKGEKMTFFCPMHPEESQSEAGTCKQCGMKLLVQNRMCARADMADVIPGEVTTTFHLYGVKDEDADVIITRPFQGLDQLEATPKDEGEKTPDTKSNIIKGPGH